MPDDGDLFLKDGAPVKFCFHRSVTQGRGQITRDVERHGGQIIPDERTAHVLLVDEQEDIEFLRRQYYSSTERYRLSIYVEPRGFVKACIRSGTYQHVGPAKQGRGRRRVLFTEENRDHLAYYLATRYPIRDGRMGHAPYKDLERLGQTGDASWAWASRHTWASWREQYKTQTEMMDPRIAHYVRRLHNVGHHFGHDARSHDHCNLQRQLAEEDESDEEEAWNGIGGQEEQGHDAPVPRPQQRAARDYLARHDGELLIIEGEEEEIVPKRVKRHASPEVCRRDVRGAQAKKARISTDERQTPDAKASRDRSSPVNTEEQESEEIEGNDLFGDHDYDHFDDQDVEYPVPFSPRASPGPPPSTQAALIASPRRTEEVPTFTRVARPTRMAIEDHARMPPPPTAPLNSLVMSEEPAAVVRIPVHGLPESGPSVSRGRRADELCLNTRARSRSIELPSQPAQRKDKRMEEIMEEQMEEDIEIGGASVNNGISTVEDEKAVERLLEGAEDDDEGDGEEESDSDFGDLPPFEEVKDADSEPSDLDDKETHGPLVQGARERESGSEGDEDEDEEDDVERIERMARGKLVAAHVAVRFSPRRMQSATQQAKEATSRVTRATRGRQ